MRKAFGVPMALVFFAIFGSAQNSKENAAGTQRDDSCDAASTQLEMNQCAGEQFRKEDVHLNEVYATLLKQIGSGPALQKLKLAEKAWIHYRDLHCAAAKYEYEAGSMSPMVWAQCMATTTKHRIEEIKAAYENEDKRLE